MAEWVTRWNYEMSAKPVRPGIWRLRKGGHLVRARITLPSGKRKTIQAALYDAKTPAEAQRELDDRVAKAKATATGKIQLRQRWGAFAIERLNERQLKGKIESEATVERWEEALEVLIPAFGHLWTDEVSHAHIDNWINTQIAEWMTKGRKRIVKRREGGKSRRTRELVDKEIVTQLKPSYVNGWLRILRAICNAAKVKFDLPKSAFEGIEFFEEGRAHTREEPNALPPGEQMQQFMDRAFKLYPQHYAMVLLGFVTGLRPSSLRPIRWKGPTPDIDFETGRLQIRRSHSRGQKIMDKTKTGIDNEIVLPKSVLDVLAWHLGRLPDEVKDKSDLLFPSTHKDPKKRGLLLTRNVLAVPFKKIRDNIGVSFRLTPKAMRRTFNDLARAAGLKDVITRSISGHQTEKMQIHYSTAGAEEQRSELEKVRKLLGQAPIAPLESVAE